MQEPKVEYATVRDGDDELHLECRMSDGQKGAFITVSSEFPKLAFKICMLLEKEYESEYKKNWNK